MGRPKLLYRWFLVLLLCFECRGCLEVERAALLQIKDSMTSPHESAFSNWYGEECCEWEGIECGPTRIHIHNIFFHYWMDGGNGELIQPWYPNLTLFAQFQELQELELPGNHIRGFLSLHAFSQLKWLQRLDLRDNSIQDGSSLCWGTSPLYFLDLSGNMLQGNVPDCLGANLFQLQHLDLSNNPFNGSFPALLISNLTKIESLILSRNELHGTISLCIFANLSKLNELDISFNHLQVQTEVESSSCPPSFSLNSLFLGGCNLKKVSPWLLHNITSELWLGGNDLTGPFPWKFHNFSSKLTSLDVSNNFLHGTLPRDINLNFPRLRHLDLSKNSFNGNLPPFFGNLLQMLHLSDNQFQGEIPHSMTSNMSCLLYLRLSGNNLTGDLFSKNSSLPKLRRLYLGRNQFSGTFPYVLSKSVELEIVDIQNNDLSGELSSYLPVLPKLKHLLLGRNRFRGQIPRQLCQMRDLNVLDLSRNSLSGEIPDCLDNVTSWTDGSYPPYFATDSWNSIEIFINGILLSFEMMISALRGIDVSSNRLTELESMDLSHNNLFGTVPRELTHLEFLEVFNISFNNLSGMIPMGKQFETFSNDSYLGNPDLCGLPLSNKCDGNAKTPPVYGGAKMFQSLPFGSFLISPSSMQNGENTLPLSPKTKNHVFRKREMMPAITESPNVAVPRQQFGFTFTECTCRK
ncbi:hypothetical protein GQ457_10G018760 [Hibiscus cannabinus]